MKNNIKTSIFPFMALVAGLIILACISACLISFLGLEDPVMLASSMFRVKLPNNTTVIANDNSPGLPFPGGASDGYVFIVLQISSEKIAEFTNTLKESSYWKSLPLSEELAQNENWLQPSIGIEETIPITTSTGYYLFIDSQEEYNKEHGEQYYDTSKPFYDRLSFNFTFGLFNDKDGKLYLWHIDT
jgi:hypothetical protein